MILGPSPLLESYQSSLPTKVKAKPKSKSQSKADRRSYVTSPEVDRMTQVFLQPNFRPPRRLRVPTPPSLRASQLPPPCAELDERPRWRIRRFVLWSQRVPPLRLAVLDPRRQGHLKRFQSYATPSTPTYLRGDRSVSFDLRVRSAVLQSTNEDATSRSASTTSPIPLRSQPSPAFFSPAPLGRPPANTTTTRKGKSTPHGRKRERCARLQHRWVLEREEERRWRMVMQILMADMNNFVRSFSVHEPGQYRPTWFSTVSPDRIKAYIQSMKDIRSSSKNAWKHLVDMSVRTELDPGCLPVPLIGLKQAKEEVRIMRDKAEKRKQKKEDRAQAAQAKVQDTSVSSLQPDERPQSVIRQQTSLQTGRTLTRGRQVARQPHSPAPHVPTEHRDKQSSTASSSSFSERLVTPPSSPHSRARPDWADSPKRSKSHLALSVDEAIPDDIARQLADMLGTFQRMRLAYARKRHETSSGFENTASAAIIEVASPESRTTPIERTRDGQSLQDVSVGSQSSDDDEPSIDGLTWATGELNLDDDTNALWSGGGTDLSMSP